MWSWRYEVVWSGTSVDATGEKGALLPARPERRHPNFDRFMPSESLDLRAHLRAQTANKPCQVPSCRRHAITDSRWCEWHTRSRAPQRHHRRTVIIGQDELDAWADVKDKGRL